MFEPITDKELQWVVLGALRAAAQFEAFPVAVAAIQDNYSDAGEIQSFTIVTPSGNRYRITAVFDGRE